MLPTPPVPGRCFRAGGALDAGALLELDTVRNSSPDRAACSRAADDGSRSGSASRPKAGCPRSSPSSARAARQATIAKMIPQRKTRPRHHPLRRHRPLSVTTLASRSFSQGQPVFQNPFEAFTPLTKSTYIFVRPPFCNVRTKAEPQDRRRRPAAVRPALAEVGGPSPTAVVRPAPARRRRPPHPLGQTDRRRRAGLEVDASLRCRSSPSPTLPTSSSGDRPTSPR